MTRRPVPFLVALAAVPTAALAVWAWRRWGYPVHAVERDVATAAEPPPTPEPAGPRALQPEESGVGPRFHRRYRVDIAHPELTAEEVIERIGSDVQHFAPAEIAVFHKTRGAEGRLAVGDEFDITIRSPWNGPVRVVEAEPTWFTLATLEGHLEAGKIRFEAAPHPSVPGALRFTIESWARSADAAVDVVYDDLGVAKEAQQAMWTYFCEQVAEDCGGERMGAVEVETERAPDPEDDG